MSRPRFSIVIPTRERAHTLYFAVRSCLAQAFEDYEIIVCDNCGSPATRHALERLGSPKVRYVRSDVPLAMNDNWELALSHARGEFITVVGDDDGLLRHALCEADRLLRYYKTPVLRWNWIFYNWPDHSSQINADRLVFSVEGECQLVQSRRLFQDLIADPRGFHQLPMIYNSFIHRDLIAQVHQRTGRMFKARSPDVYSGFVFADLAKEFVSVTRPMGICGTSGKSFGQALILGDSNNSERAKEFVDLLSPSGLTWNNRVPHLPKLISAVIAESYGQFLTNFHPRATWHRKERKSLITSALRDLREHSNISDIEWKETFLKIKQWCDDDAHLKAWFHAQYAAESDPSFRKSRPTPQWQTGFKSDRFVVDCRAFGISDTDAVASFIENLLGCSRRPVALRRTRSAKLRRFAQKVLPPALYRAIESSVDSVRRKAS